MKTIESAGFRRGDVYYVRYDQGVGSEEAIGRPYLIVSSDAGNNTSPLLTVIPLTTSVRYLGVGIELSTPRRRSWAICNNISTLDKIRFGDYMCSLSAAEMAKIDAALVETLELPVINDKKQAEHDKQIEIMKQALQEAEKKASDSSLEIEVLKKAYERVLDKLVDMRIEKDVSARVPVEPIKESDPEPKVEIRPEPAQETSELVDINRCTFDDLRALNFSTNIALNILNNRPFMDIEDLKVVPGVTRVAYGLVEKKITVGDTAEFKQKKSKPVKKPKTTAKAVEWDKPITWDEFKRYLPEKQKECLAYFADKWGCNTKRISEMFGVHQETVRKYIERNNLRGILKSFSSPDDAEAFSKWLKDNSEV